MSGFSVEWLDLREPADKAARNTDLQRQMQSWLQRNPAPILLDLGAGTGSTLRSLSDVQAAWRLVDLDGRLLGEAFARHGNTHQLDIYQQDLTQVGQLPLAEVSLVTASALFDLASAAFCDALIMQLVERHIGLYAALNYDGITQWSPAHPLDDAVLAAFNRDQLRDKGMGPALGPGAIDYLAQRLQQEGFTVHIAASPWQLDAQQRPMQESLIPGITGAVNSHIESELLQDWLDFRMRNISSGTCIVGHQDLLALPPG